MEVSPYPCVHPKAEGYLGGYSEHLSDYCEKLGGMYSSQPFFGDREEFVDLWKLALYTFQPYSVADLVAASGFPGPRLQYSVLGAAPPFHLQQACMRPAEEEQAHVFLKGTSPSGNFGVNYNYNYNVVALTDAVDGGVLLNESCGDISKRAGSPPHEAFFLVLQYLGLPELLSMEQVCRSLQDWIRSDTSLWRDVRVEFPLNAKLTDEALTRLCSRAQGYLRTLVLNDCCLISNDAVHEILVTNLMLSKLHLLWDSRVSADGLVKMIQQHNEIGGQKLRQLWIRGLGVTKEQLRELREALQPEQSRPRFYGCRELQACEDERCMDTEACPRCGRIREIYDCPRQKCVEQGPEQCRACILCIARCKSCGTCLEEVKYRENFCLEFICYRCLMAGKQGKKLQGIVGVEV